TSRAGDDRPRDPRLDVDGDVRRSLVHDPARTDAGFEPMATGVETRAPEIEAVRVVVVAVMIERSGDVAAAFAAFAAFAARCLRPISRENGSEGVQEGAWAKTSKGDALQRGRRSCSRSGARRSPGNSARTHAH